MDEDHILADSMAGTLADLAQVTNREETCLEQDEILAESTNYFEALHNITEEEQNELLQTLSSPNKKRKNKNRGGSNSNRTGMW
ncbi:hypothetical protein AgCh_010132 [Apium graveolens]